jgi:hypothetical protein
MNRAKIKLLKTLRRLYLSIDKRFNTLPICEQDHDLGSKIILEKISAPSPCMITRFGAFELNALVSYLGVKQSSGRYYNYIRGRSPQFWWEPKLINSMHNNAGFFPPDINLISQFCQLMLEDIKHIDILGSWLPEERYIEERLKGVQRLFILLLEPFWSKSPWTKALEGKKVLVVHPFSQTIENQYKKRKYLHSNINILPDFDLKIIKAVQSNAGQKVPFVNWFEALDYMKKEIDKIDYDICLIGAGAYGLSLAAHVKKMNKKAIHLGGSLQLIFGIKGRRWESSDYNQKFNYLELMNEHWVKPHKSETPTYANKVEGSCYW